MVPKGISKYPDEQSHLRLWKEDSETNKKWERKKKNDFLF